MKEGAEGRTDQRALRCRKNILASVNSLNDCSLSVYILIETPIVLLPPTLARAYFPPAKEKAKAVYHTWQYAVIVITDSVYFYTGQNLRVAALHQTKVCLAQYTLVTVNSISIHQSFLSFGRIPITDPLTCTSFPTMFPPQYHTANFNVSLMSPIPFIRGSTTWLC